MTTDRAASTSLSPRLTLVLSVAAGLTVANIYYNQPMLGLMETELGVGTIRFVPASTQLGYALGLLLLVPLGDAIERRKLILIQSLWLIVALALAALAPSPIALICASIAVGVGSTIAQQIIPLAAQIAPEESRGQVVGTVMGGLLSGILLARTVSGIIGKHYGWRAMFWIGSAMAILTAIMLALLLPRVAVTKRHSYPELLRSLGTLLRAQPKLRRAIVVQGMLFGAFSAFWTTLALLLEGPPFHLGSDIAGLFGVIGVAGVLAAPIAGRMADRRPPSGIRTIGAALVLVSFVIFGAVVTIPGLIAGVIIMDAGTQISLIANQSIIFALDGSARNRINTLFMTGMFLVGAAASGASAWLWHRSGWLAVVALGAAAAVIAVAVSFISARSESAAPADRRAAAA